MKITPTYLRQHVYEILDRILQTGEEVAVERHGREIRLSVESPPRRRDLSKLAERDDIVVGDPEDIVHLDWSSEWKP